MPNQEAKCDSYPVNKKNNALLASPVCLFVTDVCLYFSF